ncbi:hypothetical protein BYT27DRAFT_7215692 [Phlegmacium glaucopus]|nr:hypothetical protein BYT27DRAFT_7215692 [Phlegmacium glaucopus]
MVQLKDVINTMMYELGQSTKEVTRVSQEVKTEGYPSIDHDIWLISLNRKLGGQALVRSIAKVTKVTSAGAEVTRVTLEVGSQGKLVRGQVHVLDVEGARLNLVWNVYQVWSIAVVTTAVIRGDLTQKIEISIEGEMSTLKGTVNPMVDQLSAFTSEVTSAALEVGTQGILGGQARVEGVQGT